MHWNFRLLDRYRRYRANKKQFLLAREYQQRMNTGRKMMEDAFLAFPNLTEAMIATTEALAYIQNAQQNEEASNFFGGRAHDQNRRKV